MMLKWAFIAFAVAALALYGLTRVISWLNPPRPGRPQPLLLARTRRALRWSVIVPALLGLAVLAITLLRGPS